MPGRLQGDTVLADKGANQVSDRSEFGPGEPFEPPIVVGFGSPIVDLPAASVRVHARRANPLVGASTENSTSVYPWAPASAA